MLSKNAAYATFQDKILQSTGRGQKVTVTNDGATILKSLHVDNPAAKVLVGEFPQSCQFEILIRKKGHTEKLNRIKLWLALFLTHVHHSKMLS